MAEGIPLEAILTELFLSGEVERNYRLLRLEGYVAQMDYHSPASQYGQLSRVPEFTHLDVTGPMQKVVDGIKDGSFANEWDAERDAGFPKFKELKEAAVGGGMAELEADIRRQLGETAS
jgi:ketol-acid reductoisomerase